MHPDQIELVKSTVPILREHGVALTSYFYQRMINNHPELKNTFNLDHQSTGRQARALATAVLAYAENIENPSVLAKAIERITTKHVSLDIQPDQYAIVGENLLNSISEVLNVPMDSELIAAWKAAYMQLAEILIGIEKTKYTSLAAKQGGWAGWRNFVVTSIAETEKGKKIVLKPQDQAEISTADVGDFISVRVAVPGQDIRQPQQFHFQDKQEGEYHIFVEPMETATEFTVSEILRKHVNIHDIVEVSAPVKF